MIDNRLFQIVINLAFIYLILGVAAAAISEAISNYLNIKSKYIEKAITNVFGETSYVEVFYQHPLILGLCDKSPFNTHEIQGRFNWLQKLFGLNILLRYKKVGKPSAISTDTISLVIKDILSEDYNKLNQKYNLKNKITDIESSKIAERFNIFSLSNNEFIEYDLDVMRKWFDEQMTHVNYWYRQYKSKIIFFCAAFIVLFVNADTIMMTNVLWNDSIIVSAIESESITKPLNNNRLEDRLIDAESPNRKCSDCPQRSPVDIALETSSKRPFPLGWTISSSFYDLRSIPFSFSGWISKLIGLLLTAILISLGVPFWEEFINKIFSLKKNIEKKK